MCFSSRFASHGTVKHSFRMKWLSLLSTLGSVKYKLACTAVLNCWLRPLTLRAWLRRQLKVKWTMSCRWSRRCRYLLKLLTSPLLLSAAPLNVAEQRSVARRPLQCLVKSFCQSFAMKRFGLLMIYAVLSRVRFKNVFFHVCALCVGKALATGWDKSLLL